MTNGRRFINQDSITIFEEDEEEKEKDHCARFFLEFMFKFGQPRKVHITATLCTQNSSRNTFLGISQ